MTDILPVQPFQETLNASMCGPASLKIVLGYYCIEKSEDELALLCGTDPELGTSDEGIRRAAEDLGFTVEVKNNSTFEDIQNWLDKKVPVIVNWFSRGRTDYDESEVPDGHFSVVAGLDEKRIYLQDPEIGKLRQIDRNDFERVWFDFRGEFIKPEELVVRQGIVVYR